MRLAVLSRYPVYTAELCRALRTVAPEIAVSPWAGGRVAAADVVLVEYGTPDAEVVAVCAGLARTGVPYVVTLHEVGFTLDRDVLRHAVAVVVLSTAARQALVATGLVAANRIVTVPFGAPLELIGDAVVAPLSGVLLDLCGRTVLTTLGLRRPASGVEVAVSALPRIAEQRPDVCYVVGAPHRAAADRLRQRAADLGVADRLILLDAPPKRTELITLLRSTAVYVAPDLDAGRTLSASLTYAVAAGRPVVATAHPYAREIVPAETGELVPPADPVALAGAVTALLADPDRCRAARRVAQGPGRLPSSRQSAERIAELLRWVTARPVRVLVRPA
jgi:glycosyltransferase involved in cell wall biosynthesis